MTSKLRTKAMGILVNGQTNGAVNPADRGLAYGDGVFRTCLLRAGRAVCWARHYRKLQADCDAIGLPCPPSHTLLAELTIAASGLPEAAGKIIVTRGEGPRGYAAPASPLPTRIVSAGPLPSYPAGHREQGVNVRRCRLRLAIQPRLAGVKHLNRLENVIARAEWADDTVAEGLLLDAEGHVIEGIATNIFAVRKGVLQTPDLSRCGVSGVTRERIIDAAVRDRVPLRVVDLSWDDLLGADEVVLVNSLIGAWRVRSLADRTWEGSEWTVRVRGWLDGAED